MLPSTPCQPLPWLFTSHEAWHEATVSQAGYLSVHPSAWGQADHRGHECLAPWTSPTLAPWPLTGDVRALVGGPLPRHPRCRSPPDVLQERGWGVSVGAPPRLRCASVRPTVLSCHCLPLSLSLLPSPPALVRSRMPTVPRLRQQSKGTDPEQNKHYLDGCLLYS